MDNRAVLHQTIADLQAITFPGASPVDAHIAADNILLGTIMRLANDSGVEIALVGDVIAAWHLVAKCYNP